MFVYYDQALICLIHFFKRCVSCLIKRSVWFVYGLRKPAYTWVELHWVKYCRVGQYWDLQYQFGEGFDLRTSCPEISNNELSNVNVMCVSTCLETEKTQVPHVVLSWETKYKDQKLLDSSGEDAEIFVPFFGLKRGGGCTLGRIDLCPLEIYFYKLEKSTSATDCCLARNQVQLWF